MEILNASLGLFGGEDQLVILVRGRAKPIMLILELRPGSHLKILLVLLSRFSSWNFEAKIAQICSIASQEPVSRMPHTPSPHLGRTLPIPTPARFPLHCHHNVMTDLPLL